MSVFCSHFPAEDTANSCCVLLLLFTRFRGYRQLVGVLCAVHTFARTPLTPGCDCSSAWMRSRPCSRLEVEDVGAFTSQSWFVRHGSSSDCDVDINWKERTKCFNDALNTFYLRLYGVRHMVKDHSDSERGSPLLPHGLLFLEGTKEGNVLFNDALNTFYLQLYWHQTYVKGPFR